MDAILLFFCHQLLSFQPLNTGIWCKSAGLGWSRSTVSKFLSCGSFIPHPPSFKLASELRWPVHTNGKPHPLTSLVYLRMLMSTLVTGFLRRRTLVLYILYLLYLYMNRNCSTGGKKMLYFERDSPLLIYLPAVYYALNRIKIYKPGKILHTGPLIGTTNQNSPN